MQKFYRPLYSTAIISILIAVCCNSVSDIYEPELNIYCLLWCPTSHYTVLVDRTYEMRESSGDYISDALVILSDPYSVDTLQYMPADSAYHPRYPLNIVPEAIYELTVIKEGFNTVTAETKTPGNFNILYPQPFDTLTVSDTIILTKSSGAHYYWGYFIDVNYNLIPFWYVPDTLDSLIRIPVPFYLHFAHSGWYDIEIQACDNNYYLYSQFGTEQDSVLQAGVTGGVGVFASRLAREVHVYLLLN